ncbi:uncharacterized protein MONOS_13417 [Monocercomonoides exilis]|uniref:uncharacterized protein n=1 Tax=Monocercomonoides exilis TaxID=2049356 RepID=UPI00355AAA12|nr:hypothetical protein MONOS_13417 [Monocercomonoides exilis]|eukprot:MONOS_13417.1-p1 / transcript=MONOS_13417.1 / gene=MONOS_13417 / organism=Monocercomonoides_exilis_PA203 / gene_product=unspecified product / transcript_product=unspecified product / location=Mono_scaffold00824:23972-25988(+) / protein_length=607 / sequence_SO=supercontig / SO=protein_coding / is_pseudo=false
MSAFQDSQDNHETETQNMNLSSSEKPGTSGHELRIRTSDEILMDHLIHRNVRYEKIILERKETAERLQKEINELESTIQFCAKTQIENERLQQLIKDLKEREKREAKYHEEDYAEMEKFAEKEREHLITNYRKSLRKETEEINRSIMDALDTELLDIQRKKDNYRSQIEQQEKMFEVAYSRLQAMERRVLEVEDALHNAEQQSSEAKTNLNTCERMIQLTREENEGMEREIEALKLKKQQKDEILREKEELMQKIKELKEKKEKAKEIAQQHRNMQINQLMQRPHHQKAGEKKNKITAQKEKEGEIGLSDRKKGTENLSPLAIRSSVSYSNPTSLSQFPYDYPLFSVYGSDSSSAFALSSNLTTARLSQRNSKSASRALSPALTSLSSLSSSASHSSRSSRSSRLSSSSPSPSAAGGGGGGAHPIRSSSACPADSLWRSSTSALSSLLPPKRSLSPSIGAPSSFSSSIMPVAPLQSSESSDKMDKEVHDDNDDIGSSSSSSSSSSISSSYDKNKQEKDAKLVAFIIHEMEMKKMNEKRQQKSYGSSIRQSFSENSKQKSEAGKDLKLKPLKFGWTPKFLASKEKEVVTMQSSKDFTQISIPRFLNP